MLFISVCLFFISSMSLMIVLTVLNASCIFSILCSSFQSIFIIIILNSLSGRVFISSLFICVFFFFFWVSTLLFHWCCISVFSSFLFFFKFASLEVSFPQALGLYYFFLLSFAFGGKCWSGGLCCFLVRGNLCLCSSGGSSSR